MKTAHVLASSLLLLVVAACSGSTEGTGPANADGGKTAADSTGTSTGKACSATGDCAYWYCECNDGAVVNSRSCADGSCQGPTAHCDSACTAFGHGAWTGEASGGDGAQSTSSSSSSSGSGAACTVFSDCPSFSCGCSDGSRGNVQTCTNGVCLSASTGCENACLSNGHGDWDGT